MKRIKITIYPDGYVGAETVGIKRKICDKYKPLLERILQNRIVEMEHTEEYYEMEEIENFEREEIRLNGQG